MRLPRPGEKGGLERFDRKLAQQEKRLLEKQRRLAEATPEERARVEAWDRAHRPGKASERARLRDQRATAQWLADIIKATEPPSDQEDVFA